MCQTPKGGSSAEMDSVAMPLKGAYFNGGFNVSQFHYDSGELEISRILQKLPSCGITPRDALLAPPCLILLIMPQERQNCL